MNGVVDDVHLSVLVDIELEPPDDVRSGFRNLLDAARRDSAQDEDRSGFLQIFLFFLFSSITPSRIRCQDSNPQPTWLTVSRLSFSTIDTHGLKPQGTRVLDSFSKFKVGGP